MWKDGAHGYLITNFLSKKTNKRTDWYGGTLEDRMRFLLEVVENIRKKVGSDYPLGVRLSGTEYDPPGIEIEETIEIAKALENAGVDVLHISAGNHHTMHKQVVHMYFPPAYNVWLAEKVKKAVSIPVIAVGAITTPELGEQILREGKADFIALGRPLIADPYWPKKAMEGRPEDIRPCIRCNDCVGRGVFICRAICCAVNPVVGREYEMGYEIEPAPKSKKVAIIGGGPGGLEAARVAALRGHEVTLYEKRELGGYLIEASVPEFKADLRRLREYLITQVKKVGVKIVNAEATVETILDEGYDAIIVATGASPIKPEVPGVDKPHVFDALEVLRGAKVGERVVIVGGGLIGRETALFLAQQRKKVTLSTRRNFETFAEDLGWHGPAQSFFELLQQYPIDIHYERRLKEITDDGVIVVSPDGVEHKLEGDTVILAAGLKPNRELWEALKEKAENVYAIGDCVEPRAIFDAIHEGHFIARKL